MFFKQKSLILVFFFFFKLTGVFIPRVLWCKYFAHCQSDFFFSELRSQNLI